MKVVNVSKWVELYTLKPGTPFTKRDELYCLTNRVDPEREHLKMAVCLRSGALSLFNQEIKVLPVTATVTYE